tara:strand:- start:988 stop:1209 length:222 start_codon:yes stop_codon:yes gene_type:complete
MFDDVPDWVWHELRLHIFRYDLNYADNFRAYRESDGLCKEAFLASYAAGCCGFYEGAAYHEGEKWIIGCNYDH